MRWTEFERVLKNPAAIDPAQTAELARVLKAYPYFIPAQLFRLKGLKDMDSTAYGRALPSVALYSTDRAFLFDYLSGSPRFEPSRSVELRVPPLEGCVAVDPPGAPYPAAGPPHSFESGQKHAFAQWLRLGNPHVLNPESPARPKRAEKSPGFQQKETLIDAFLAHQAPLSPRKTPPAPPLPTAFENPVPQADLMTETLARMYIEQKKYTQAIKAYKILGLKYPEKSGFFADRIKSIQKLMTQ